MLLADFLKAFEVDWTRSHVALYESIQLSFKFEVFPVEFLRFAHQDFQSKDKRGFINALTNTKRAIDCQADGLLACFGFGPNSTLPPIVKEYLERHSKAKDKVLPHRLRLLAALDVTPPSLIAKIRGIRNDLEHEYKLPSEDEVSDAMEVAALFIGTVSNVLNTFHQDYVIGNKHASYERTGKLTNQIWLTFDSAGYSFEIKPNPPGKVPGSLQINRFDPAYLDLVRLTIMLATGGDIDKALHNFLQTASCKIPKDQLRVTVDKKFVGTEILEQMKDFNLKKLLGDHEAYNPGNDHPPA